MKTRYYSVLLLALTVLCSVAPRAEAQTATGTVQTSPFPAHLLDAQKIPGVVNPTYLTESLWLSSHQVINVQNGTSNLTVFDAETGQQTPLDVVNTLAKHQEEPYNEFAIRTSPDGRWLLWPSGSKDEPTWAALSLDGQEHREWPRVTRVGGADVAWMQDSRHWVELDKIGEEFATPNGTHHRSSLRARVYDTASPQVREFPLAPDTSDPYFSLPMQGAYSQFTFTQDGRAWVSILWSGCSPTPEFPSAGSRLEAHEILPGQSAWTLRKSSLRLGSYADVGQADECVRSPDDNWLIWRNYDPSGKGPLRLVLTRTDGSDAQVIHTSLAGQSLSYIHWTPDSRHVAFYQDNGMYLIALDDLEAEADAHHPHAQNQIAGRVKTPGKFPTASPPILLALKPLRAVNSPR